MGKSELSPLLPGAKAPVTRATMTVRWLVLVLSCLLMIGNYYCFDNPAALSSQLKLYFAHTSWAKNWDVNFNLLYSVYSFPNTVLPLFGGWLCDKIGVRFSLVLFNLFIVGGQLVFALGGALKNLGVMLAGRVIFGLGGESLTVAQSALVAVWFQDKELAFALGLNLSIARVGGVINNIVSPILWNDGHLSMWVGAMICGASMACTLILIPIDRAAEKKVAQSNPDAAAIKVDERVKLSDITKFKLPFWLLTFSCLVVYGTVLPFNNVASTFLQHRNFLSMHTHDGRSSASEPWLNNRTYVIPTDCDDFKGFNSTCNLNATSTYMHAIFSGSDDSASCADDSFTVLPGVCADGYIKADDSKNVSATCCDGSLKWAPGSTFCIPANAAQQPTCGANSTFLNAYFPGNATANMACANITKADYVTAVCADGYTYRRSGDEDHGTPVTAMCCDGFWQYAPDNAGACVPVFYKPEKYCSALNDAEGKANAVMSIPFALSAALSPFVGYAIDRIGGRALLATVAPIVLIAVHSSLGFSDVTPYVPLIGQGLAYTVFAAALWPSIPYVVDSQYVGSAYGLLTAVQNFGLATFPLMVGKILSSCDNDPSTVDGDFISPAAYKDCSNSIDNFKYTELFFVCLAGVGLLVGIMLNIDDKKNRGSQLNKVHFKKSDSDKADGIN